MVARARQFTRIRSRVPPLIGTDQASAHLAVPSRTVRRWVRQRGLGQLVAGRHLLTQADLQVLVQIRDSVIT